MAFLAENTVKMDFPYRFWCGKVYSQCMCYKKRLLTRLKMFLKLSSYKWFKLKNFNFAWLIFVRTLLKDLFKKVTRIAVNALVNKRASNQFQILKSYFKCFFIFYHLHFYNLYQFCQKGLDSSNAQPGLDFKSTIKMSKLLITLKLLWWS